ncbi:MAG: hydrogenase [Deltaproteobacteria bacterium]|nr:hydrogenase [Deltaproteobacteria bacterium]
MQTWIDTLLVLVVLLNFSVLGSSRLAACIRGVALQGGLLGLFTFLAHEEGSLLRPGLLALSSIGLKGIAFPLLLFRAVREADVRREIEPYVGYSLSILMGLAVLLFALWLSGRLPLPREPASSLIVPVALFTSFVGLFIIISRKKAITQVLGYLMLENGIYTFGVGLVQGTPLLIELGVLLDVFVAVFVMGITIFHINRQFDHIDTARLALLKG